MNTKPAPLGRGLSALFGDTDSAYAPRAAAPIGAVKEKVGAPRMIPIEWLEPGAYQPRRKFDEEAIQELADSIKERGILTPLMVRPLQNAADRYEIIAGERRWRAAQKAGVHEVPVLVREMTDREAMEIGLIENVQRQDLSPLEEAEGYKRLLEEFNHTQDGLAKVVGKSRPHISNLLRLLTLPEGVKQMITDGALSMGHARTLVTAKNPEELAAEIVRKGLSVRQAEALTRRVANGANRKKTTARTSDIDADIAALEQEIARAVGLKTTLLARPNGGTLTFHYTDLDQLDALLARLRG
jgi:ParB family chromosome partitioning protein